MQLLTIILIIELICSKQLSPQPWPHLPQPTASPFMVTIQATSKEEMLFRSALKFSMIPCAQTPLLRTKSWMTFWATYGMEHQCTTRSSSASLSSLFHTTCTPIRPPSWYPTSWIFASKTLLHASSTSTKTSALKTLNPSFRWPISPRMTSSLTGQVLSRLSSDLTKQLWKVSTRHQPTRWTQWAVTSSNTHQATASPAHQLPSSMVLCLTASHAQSTLGWFNLSRCTQASSNDHVSINI